MKSVAVVILNWNGKKFLEQFLGTVVIRTPEADIIVADNGSTDDSLQYIRDYHSQVQIIEIGENKGFTGGYNFALQQIQNQYAVLLNSDIEVTENWLTPLLETIKSNENIAAVQPKIKAWHQKDTFEYAGAAGGYLDFLGYPFCRGRIFENLEKDLQQYNDTIPIFWATGACLLVNLSIYKKLGGLDEDFFAHMEEIDLCWRLKNNGYQVYYCGQSEVYHVGGGTLSKSNPRKTYLNFLNSLLMLLKNDTSGWVYFKLIVRSGLDVVAALQFYLSGKKSDANMVFKAQKNFWTKIKKWHKKRERNLVQKVPYTALGIYPKSIVWQFFVRNKKTFKEL
jgi:GT2 family glycosyltransferase